MRGEAHALAVSVPQAELHQPIEQFYSDAMNYAQNNDSGPEKGVAKLFVPTGDKQVLFSLDSNLAHSKSLKAPYCLMSPPITSTTP